jgi:hypothetical protein
MLRLCALLFFDKCNFVRGTSIGLKLAISVQY